MTRAAWLRWIATFDMEDLTSTLLRNGTVVSMGLIAASLLMQALGPWPGDLGPNLKARSVPVLIVSDIHQLGTPGAGPRVLLHLGVAALLLTPYVRVLASLLYFAVVERSRRHALLTGLVLTILTIVLLTTWV